MASCWFCRQAIAVLLLACVSAVALDPRERLLSPLSGRHGRLGSKSGRHGHVNMVKAKERGEQTCVPLLDRTTYMAVSSSVGTPAQNVELVVDSGSSTVVVVRCGQDRDGCYEPGDSTTHEDSPNGQIVSIYGKGRMSSKLETDIVRVGSATASLVGSLYAANLVADVGAIDFQGILGLGPQLADEDAHDWSQLFMEEAGVLRYALCYTPNAGAMWMNPSMPTSEAISTLPGSHWALHLEGLSAGTVASSLCTESAPCTVIPDSGTTGIAVPEGHMNALFGTLCDAWPACVEAARTGSEKSRSFFTLIYGCDEWMGENGLDELPPLNFLVKGADGRPQTLTLPAWAYVEERIATGDSGAWEGMFAQFDFPGRAHHGAPGSRVCWPAFREWSPPSESDMEDTPWILGTSLFYEYAVHFDISTTPASLAFESNDCGSCGGSQANLQASFGGDSHGARPLRRLDRPPRVFGREMVMPRV